MMRITRYFQLLLNDLDIVCVRDFSELCQKSTSLQVCRLQTCKHSIVSQLYFLLYHLTDLPCINKNKVQVLHLLHREHYLQAFAVSVKGELTVSI